ncbi:zeta toxin family protein [Streptomyces noursei]|uniref:zeta toxin family protein n=1 Tax=Streptomyces noursei TaxID=1971 RepID=UPI0033293C68
MRNSDCFRELPPRGRGQAGYRVELVVLAVRAADSRQGTASRYAQASGSGTPARFTTASGHDVHFDALPAVVAAAEQLAVADSVRVMRRDAHVLYRNEQEAQGAWARHPAGALALAAQTVPRPHHRGSRPVLGYPARPARRCPSTATTSSRSAGWHAR